LTRKRQNRPETAPELARVIDAWPGLSPAAKRMIVAAVEASGADK
jgi:hypothetical protein